MTTLPPWRRRTVRAPQPDVIVHGGQPLAQLTIYDDLILLARQERNEWRQYPVSAAGLISVFAALPTASGLLPLHTLAVGSVAGRPFAVRYVPPRMATLRTEQRSYDVPLPPLVFGGCGQDYRVFALDREGYPDSDWPLCDPPFPNSYRDGHICWGSSDPRPDVSPATLEQALSLFLEGSYFNSHVAHDKSRAFPVGVIARWERLAEERAGYYPLDDLIPTGVELRWLCAGGPWGGQR